MHNRKDVIVQIDAKRCDELIFRRRGRHRTIIGRGDAPDQPSGKHARRGLAAASLHAGGPIPPRRDGAVMALWRTRRDLSERALRRSRLGGFTSQQNGNLQTEALMDGTGQTLEHHMRSGIKWSFTTAKLRVEFKVQRERAVKYDGDDEDGETQRKLDSGEFVSFSSSVEVICDGEVIGESHLGGSVYADGEESQFWTAHRDPDFMNRNCAEMRAARGNITICHYFPDMVREALREAREKINAYPRLRAA